MTAFSLPRTDHPGTAARAVALAELETAYANAESDVHEARKRGKKLRSLFRLVRTSLGTDYKRLDSAIRDAGRALTDLRRRDALLETCNFLDERAPQCEWPVLATIVGDAMGQDAGRAVRMAQRRLATTRDYFLRWDPSSVTAAELRDGFLRTYSSGRRRLARVRDPEDVLALHEWRKQTKYHRYQCALLQAMWPATIRKRRTALKKLTDLLGEHHDLADLIRLAESHQTAIGARRLARMQRCLSALQAEHAQQALALGPTLFEHKPSYWHERLPVTPVIQH